MKTFLEFRIVTPHIDDTLGIMRHEMPQIEHDHYDDYFEYMREHGVTFKKEMVKPHDLRATQQEFADAGIVTSIMKSADAKRIFKPILISSDDYVIDGHHRWLAKLNTLPEGKIEAFRANKKGKEVLELTKKFKWVTFKPLH